ncbi:MULTISPECIES: TetR/AcrR family transcriptional regulator [Tsukamurella]|uniref:TetR family transcriptional regulator n=2 Tax=Tsukamurella TaxID=2060 RepID=A0A5C5S752_9ACTN|nr:MULTISPECIES: TetR family transcriptional regulator [Tsukamurella]NMD57519.1 TetR family transcriptional regulator [Tsukamurella columbiensis]TWS30924.1 TetR family transcriptional regulator [Tsukamurella conjunctivitidis]
MGRREEVLDGAIEVLGTRGLRGLTHRAVDEVAAVPQGTASNHFRSRSALVKGVVERMVEQDLAFWAGFDGAAPADPGAAADVLPRAAAYVRWSVGEGRVRSVARLNLFAAAAVEPELQEPLRRGRAAVERMGEAIGAAIGLGAAESALLMDVTDALITRQLAFPDPAFDPLPALALTVDALRRRG